MKLLRNLLIIFCVGSVLVFFQLKKRVSENGPLSESVSVDIEKGSSSQRVADILLQQNVVDSALLFRLLIRFEQAGGKIKAGEYLFEPHISMLEVLDKLVKGDVVYHKLTIPEGYTVGQVLFLLAKEPYLDGEIDYIPDEGSLLPETYTFTKGEKRSVIVQKAMSSMQKKLQEIWNERDEALPYKSVKDLLVMASIIEKETGVGDERAKVSSVFINRLKKGMLLQTDPTVIYALTRGKEDLSRSLTRGDLQIDSPYNTYRYVGLPPTPICNPGEAAIWAAAHPEMTDYFYFVANGSGGHNFAKTLSEHNRNVAEWKNVRSR